MLPFISRWGRAVQHSHREHSGCGKAGGGVFQDEKCKDPTSATPIKSLDGALRFCPISLPRLVTMLFYRIKVFKFPCSPSFSDLFPSSRCSRLSSQRGHSTSRPTTVSRLETGLTSWPKLASATASAWAPTILQPTSTATGSAANSQQMLLPVARLALGMSRCWNPLVCFLYVCLRSLILLRASVFSGLPANIQLDVDGDRETERIYSLFSTYMTKLIKMQGQALKIMHQHPSSILHVDIHAFPVGLFPPQRPVAVSLYTMGQNRRSTLVFWSMTHRRPTKPWSW